MNEEKILACPFCGGEGDLTTTTDDETIDYRHTVICSPGCGGSGPVAVSPSLAIMQWNERAGGREPEAAQNARNIVGSISANGCAPFAIAIIDAPAKCPKCGSRYVSPTTGKVRNDCHCGGELVTETLGHNAPGERPGQEARELKP